MLAKIYASMSWYAEAANALSEFANNPDSIEAQAANLLRLASANARFPETIPALPPEPEFATFMPEHQGGHRVI
jgi:hypothetical protein